MLLMQMKCMCTSLTKGINNNRRRLNIYIYSSIQAHLILPILVVFRVYAMRMHPGKEKKMSLILKQQLQERGERERRGKKKITGSEKGGGRTESS